MRHHRLLFSLFSMSPKVMEAVIRVVDKDGDGMINYGEFLTWWREYAMEQVFLKFDTDGTVE